MTKTYSAKTHVSISVLLKSNKSARISFSPMTRGGSSYTTANKELQEAIEKHSQFGKMFKLTSSVEDAPKAPKTEKAKGLKEMKVASLDDAREYLVETLNHSWTKLKTQDAIMAAGKANGIQFIIEK